MKYEKINIENYNIHAIKTNKFKTISIKINFKRKIKKEEITIRNLLINALFTSTKKYPTKRLLEIETEELYGLVYHGSNIQSGIYNIMSIDISYLNERYTERDINKKCIDYLAEIIYNPNISNNEFSDLNFNIAYNDLYDSIISLKENTNLYSQIRMLENMEDSCVSYRGCGYLEDLEIITKESLYKYYLSVLENDIVDIFVLGDFDDSLIDYIKEKFTFKNRIKCLDNHFYKFSNVISRENEVIEKNDTTQSKLVIGLKLDNLTDFELRYVLNIYNYILGGSADSKLFKNIREKESLCYSISSYMFPLTSMLIIKAGINAKDYQKTLKLIKKELNDMQNGKFKELDIKNGKITYINGLEEIKDSPSGIISLYAGMAYLNSDNLENRIKNIKSVTKEDVINLTKKIKLDTIYLLEGTKNED